MCVCICGIISMYIYFCIYCHSLVHMLETDLPPVRSCFWASLCSEELTVNFPQDICLVSKEEKHILLPKRLLLQPFGKKIKSPVFRRESMCFFKRVAPADAAWFAAYSNWIQRDECKLPTTATKDGDGGAGGEMENVLTVYLTDTI